MAFLDLPGGFSQSFSEHQLSKKSKQKGGLQICFKHCSLWLTSHTLYSFGRTLLQLLSQIVIERKEQEKFPNFLGSPKSNHSWCRKMFMSLSMTLSMQTFPLPLLEGSTWFKSKASLIQHLFWNWPNAWLQEVKSSHEDKYFFWLCFPAANILIHAASGQKSTPSKTTSREDPDTTTFQSQKLSMITPWFP